MAAQRDEIIGFCDELLAAGEFDDYGPKGLQVPGANAVAKVITGVSAHLELIELAVAAGADLLVAHHGLFWEFHPRALTEAMTRRLRVALAADLSVAGYHLPLDAHPRIGNNALLRDALGFDPSPEPFGRAKGRSIGVVGRHREGLAPDELVGRIRELTGRDPLVFSGTSDPVRSIGIVSGAGSSAVHEAAALELDALLTGEPAEHAMADAREAGLHFIAAGHYATETLGIRRLGDEIGTRFGIEHEFIGVPNPV